MRCKDGPEGCCSAPDECVKVVHAVDEEPLCCKHYDLQQWEDEGGAIVDDDEDSCD